MFAFHQSRLGLDKFHQVLSKRSGRWYNACLRITRDAQLAEDAVQDALLKARGDSAPSSAAQPTWTPGFTASPSMPPSICCGAGIPLQTRKPIPICMPPLRKIRLNSISPDRR
jgi:hypothetical protein